jgi:hypothetical protein
MSRVLILLLFLFILRCRNEMVEKSHLSGENLQPVAKIEQESFLKSVKEYDTLTSRGNYLHYSLDSENNVLITWGNLKTGDRGTFTDHNLFCGFYPSRLDCEWEDYLGIIFTGNCHYSQMNLLPLNKKDAILTYISVADYDVAQNFVLTYNGDFIYTLENVVTKNNIQIRLSGCGSFCGIEHRFVKGGIHFKWEYWVRDSVESRKRMKGKTFWISR